MGFFSRAGRPGDRIGFLRGRRPGLRLLASRIATDLVFVSAHFGPRNAPKRNEFKGFRWILVPHWLARLSRPACWPGGQETG